MLCVKGTSLKLSANLRETTQTFLCIKFCHMRPPSGLHDATFIYYIFYIQILMTSPSPPPPTPQDESHDTSYLKFFY